MISLDLAKALAIKSGEALKDYCEIIHITGSVRRLASQHDIIELICVPRYTESVTVDLFGGKVHNKIISENFIAAVKDLGIIHNRSNEKLLQVKLKRGNINLGIHMPQPADFYRQYALTTGGPLYVKNTIIPAWVKQGWHETPNGLRKPAQPGSGLQYEYPPLWENEEAFFSWLRVSYIAARMRRL